MIWDVAIWVGVFVVAWQGDKNRKRIRVLEEYIADLETLTVLRGPEDEDG